MVEFVYFIFYYQQINFYLFINIGNSLDEHFGINDIIIHL